MSYQLIIIGAAALLTAGVLRCRSYLRSGNPGTGYLAIAATAAGLALLLNAPAVYTWCDHVIFRRSNTSALVSFALTVAGATAAGEMVASLADDRPAATRRIRLAACASVIIAMLIAFLTISPVREAPTFFARYAHDPRLLTFWIIFTVSAGAQVLFVSTGTLRVRHGDRWLVRGLRLIGAGSGLVVLFLIDCLLQVLAPIIPTAANTVGTGVLLSGGFVIACGVLLPQLGSLVEHALLLRRLRPLWAVVTSRYPYVRSDAGRSRLYRTVIEIDDALAEARAHHQLDTPLLRALDALSARPAQQFDTTVRDLVSIARNAPELSARGLRTAGSR